MERQLLHAVAVKRVCAFVGPHIGAIPAVLAQFEVVDVRRGAVPEGVDQLVAGAVEAPHAAIVLYPDDKVQELVEDFVAGSQDLG